MSSTSAAPLGSPSVTASPPAESTATTPTSSSTPIATSPSLDQGTPPAEPPAPPTSISPPAPPPTSDPPPTSPPPSSQPAPPSVATSPSTSTSPPPPSQSPPPGSATPPPSTAPPPPPPLQSPPSSSATPPPSTAASPPAPPSSAIPPPSTATSPPPPSQSPPTSSAAPPPSTATSPPPPSQPPLVQSPPPPNQSLASPTPSPSLVSQSPPPPGQSSSVASPPPTNSILSPPPTPSSTTPSTPTTLSPPAPPSSTSSIPTSTLAAILVTGILAASVLLVLVYCFCKKKKKKVIYYSGDHHGPSGVPPAHYTDFYYDPNTKQQGWHSPHSQSSDVLLNVPPPPLSSPYMMQHDLDSPKVNSGTVEGMAPSQSWLTYTELATATNGFSKSNLLGEGGFGCVYKGVLANGQVVAVKQLKSGASQGEKEFQAEVEIISRVHHRNLVSLVGYCIAESQRLLVYDYVPNNTLEYHLHKRKGVPVMDWATRIKVASGAARGLAYLHEDCHPRIIHRDIKSANILLDNNFEAQVSDFGLAKLTSDANTHVTTRVMGTFGYLAPEYASSGKLTEKSDVFSFGVVLLELLTGRKPVDVSQRPGEESLVEWARPILARVESEEDLEMLVDPLLYGVFDSKEVMRMAEAAAACVRHSANKRPRMGQVVRALEEEISLSDLARGLKPGHSRVYGSSFSSTDYENGSYSADMRRFRRALYENTDTEVSMNPSASSSEYQTSVDIDHDTRRPMRVPRPTAFSSNEFPTSN